MTGIKNESRQYNALETALKISSSSVIILYNTNDIHEDGVMNG